MRYECDLFQQSKTDKILRTLQSKQSYKNVIHIIS